MRRDEETPNRGIFGYEGEGFDSDTTNGPKSEPRERSASRGWNIGRDDDAPRSPADEDSD